MVDFSKLNAQFDLKDLDAEKLIKLAIEHQNTLIKLALIVVTLMMASGKFNEYRQKSQALRTQTSEAQDKLGVIKAREDVLQEFDVFKSSLPVNLTEFQVIGLISQYAKSCQVTISSLSPGDSRDLGMYDLITVSFEATSGTFRDLLVFLKKIENSKYPLRIDSWAGQEVQKGKIDMQLKVSAVLIHTS